MEQTIKPTEGELEILKILWEKGPSTVRAVHEIIEQTKASGYTTTLKLMQIMYEKKLVDRDSSSKVHIYTAQVSRDNTRKHFIDKMVENVFNGNTMQMVMQALGNHKANASELEAIRKYLDQIESQNK